LRVNKLFRPHTQKKKSYNYFEISLKVVYKQSHSFLNQGIFYKRL